MDRLIFTAASGAGNSLLAGQVHANNLANINTHGFRADLEIAQAAMIQGNGYDTRHSVTTQANGIDGRSGELVDTGRDLDVAIQGEGYFAVESENGEAYTRDGNIEIDADGNLSVRGRALLSDGGPINLPEFDSMSIGSDGTITIVPKGEFRAQEIGRLKLVKLAAADAIKNEAGLIVSRDGMAARVDDSITVVTHHLEKSNVSGVSEMVATTNLSRMFEIQMKLMKTADSLADSGNRLIRGNG